MNTNISTTNINPISLPDSTNITPHLHPRQNMLAIVANMLSSLLLRISGRTSFILLSFYLGTYFSSAAFVALLLETFYISELTMAPLVGSLSDRFGRKLFLWLAPALGACATLSLILCIGFFPQPDPHQFDIKLVAILLLILASRLLEGASTALNAPACLGHIVDATTHSSRLRTRVMTLFEIITIGGMAFAIPFGGIVSSFMGNWGFLVVLVLHFLNIALILLCFREQKQQISTLSQQHGSLFTSLRLLKAPKISSFLPAWLAINTLIGAWLTLIVLMMTYPESSAQLRHPQQLFYGGYSKEFTTLLLGITGLLALAGMFGWMRLLNRWRLTTIMGYGVLGFTICIIALSIMNALGEHLFRLSHMSLLAFFALLPIVGIGVVLLSGFPPAALTHMATISDTCSEQRGAIMGLYSVVLGIGQLAGASLGGLAVDLGGFYGLMLFSSLLVIMALWSIITTRHHKHDLPSHGQA